ncbi:MAG: FAD-dependent oxidoreductase [Deltaproteobacteria bacterium]|nr:FAD-dependent oxidoreductase [Deltaproteobacteria bacterium]
MATRYDAIVVGAGPAGLTAAIYLSRSRFRTLVLDRGAAGGQVNLTHEVANYPGLPSVSGVALGRAMRAQAQSFGARFLGHADLGRLDLASPEKTIEVLDEDAFQAPVVVLATGGSPRTLGLDGETRFKGHGVSYCATCDGDFFSGKDVAVIGGGNSALEEAAALTAQVRSATIIHEFDQFQAHAWAVEEARKNPKLSFLMEQTVTGLRGAETLEAVTSVHKRSGVTTVTPVSGVFIFIGYAPNTKWLEGHVALNERGEIVVDESLRTDVPGVFAAGDARAKRYRQITTAVADGTVAALAATEYLADLARSAA